MSVCKHVTFVHATSLLLLSLALSLLSIHFEGEGEEENRQPSGLFGCENIILFFACLMLLPFTSICFSFVTFFRFSYPLVCASRTRRVRAFIIISCDIYYFCSLLPKIDYLASKLLLVVLSTFGYFPSFLLCLWTLWLWLWLLLTCYLMRHCAMHIWIFQTWKMINLIGLPFGCFGHSMVCGWFDDDIAVFELMLWTIKFKYSRLAVPFPSDVCADDDKPVTMEF